MFAMDGMTGLEVLRRQHGLTQAEVAHAIGTYPSRVSDMERGLRPTAKQLRALCALFGVPESLDHVLVERVPLPVPEVPPPPDMKERITAMRAARERERKEKA
jgi:transcriptional regulator with XRE-family HTH domain